MNTLKLAKQRKALLHRYYTAIDTIKEVVARAQDIYDQNVQIAKNAYAEAEGNAEITYDEIIHKAENKFNTSVDKAQKKYNETIEKAEKIYIQHQQLLKHVGINITCSDLVFSKKEKGRV